MQTSSSSKDALLPILNELYQRIYQAEVEIGLFAGKRDHRPRVERFHDAVRAYTSGISPYEANSRLAIEQLAWDISMLRTIQSSPLTPIPGSQKTSPSTGLAVRGENAVGGTGNPRAQARALKGQLAADYKNYAVMFTALLAETADMNHANRMEEKDALVGELANLRSSISGKTVNLQHKAGSSIYDPQTLTDVLSILPKGTFAAAEATALLNNAMTRIDQQQAKIDKAHLSWLSGQLAMYEQGKEVVQQLMRQGLNLAGRFLEETMSRSDPGRGRGY
jgi:hypothetical protein